MSAGPLAGVRVIELGGIGPAPFACMMLADLGADVVRIDRPGTELHPVMHRNRRSIALDLKSTSGRALALELVATSDVAVEGFRPGVAERLGLGPEDVARVAPRVVYGRMTGWGQDGPWSQLPGHDINYIALTGALHAIGPAGGDPVVPLNLIGDFGGGGMLLAYGVLAAVVSARTTGRGQVVDAAMIDGSAALMAMLHGYLAEGRWVDERGVNHLDGGAPYYRTYACSDGRHVAVGCIEPQFYAALLEGLGLVDDPEFAHQDDRTTWPTMVARLQATFASRTRDEWAEVFATSSACVTPVLSIGEAPLHPHHVERQTYTGLGDGHMARPVPRFAGTPAADPRPAPVVGSDGLALLEELGVDAAEVEAYLASGVVALPTGEAATGGGAMTTARELVARHAFDGMTIAVGGFGLCGNPFDLIEAVRDSGVSDLTIVSNNMGTDGKGLGVLLEGRQVRKVVASYVGENRQFAQQYLDGRLEIEFTPQGTLAERLRAGGAGIPAFYTPTGAHTSVAEGKATTEIDGRTVILEHAIVADLALVRAHLADAAGNLAYRRTARNFNPVVATAGRVTLAEVDRVLDGYLDPDVVQTPGIFVDEVVAASPRPVEIEQRTTRPRATGPTTRGDARVDA